VHVLHVDHGLRDESSDDARFVASLARHLGVDCTVLEVDVAAAAGESLEAAARNARYGALTRAAERLGLQWVATAHTLDDQAETVLMRAMRGSGTGGLAGIAPVRGIFVRPLLDVTGAELRDWLRDRSLDWREDATNADKRFERNWVRHELMPLITKRRPGAAKALARIASLARADEQTLDALADDVVERAHRDDAGILFEDIDLVPRAVATRAVRKACWLLGREPSYADVSELLVAGGARCGALTAHRMREGLAIVRDPVAVPEPLVLSSGVIASAAWGIRIRVGPASEVRWRWRSVLPGDAAVVRSRRPGDRIRTTGGTRKVQDVLTDAKVPRVLRDLVPMITVGDAVVGVVGLTRLDGTSDTVVDVEPWNPSWSRAALWSRATS
jgi:tRNA(Ile)-lysidine synthase